MQKERRTFLSELLFLPFILVFRWSFGCFCFVFSIRRQVEKWQNILFFGHWHFMLYFLYSDSVALSVVHLSPLGSQLSFGQLAATRIETVCDWDAIAKKYRSLFGGEAEETSSTRTEADNQSNASVAPHVNTVPPTSNNTAAMNQV